MTLEGGLMDQTRALMAFTGDNNPPVHTFINGSLFIQYLNLDLITIISHLGRRCLEFELLVDIDHGLDLSYIP